MTTRKKIMTEMEQRMFDVVESNGGRVDRETYFREIQESAENDGGEVSMVSLKSSTVAAFRLEGAGLQSIVIGSDKYIWTDEEVDAAVNGTTTARGALASPTVTTSTSTSTTSASPAPDVYCGIKRFDATSYPSDIAALIPTKAKGYIEQDLMGSELGYMAFCHKNKQHLITEGGTGCGKTMAAYEFARLIGSPIMRIVGGVGIEFSDLQGNLVARYDAATDATTTHFIDGQLTKAMRHGGILYIDEINFIKPSVLSQLNDVLDDGHMVLPMVAGKSGAEVIKAHPDFRVIASMNPNYAGTAPLNNATRRRFNATLAFDYLSEDLEIQVIQAQSGNYNVDAATELVKLARDCRKKNSHEQFCEPTDLGTATLVSAMVGLTQYNMSQVIDAYVLPLFDKDDKEEVLLLARARIESMA